jgi:hypothetical protein
MIKNKIYLEFKPFLQQHFNKSPNVNFSNSESHSNKDFNDTMKGIS